jgi:hypothetical protein
MAMFRVTSPGWGGHARTARVWILIVAIVLASTPAKMPAAPKATSDAQIKATIERAVAFLRKMLPNLTAGQLSLTVLALLKAGIPTDAGDMKAAIEKITARFTTDGNFEAGHDHNYDAGVTLLALASADPAKYRKQIEILARYLVSSQGPEGDWDYRARVAGDTSISQYAVLGLWEAARSGVRIPRRVWDKAAHWHISRQQRDGGFAYHPAPGGESSTHTMTVAGTASLLVSRLYLFGDTGDVMEQGDSPSRKKNRKKFGLLTSAANDVDEGESATATAPAGGTDVLSAPDGPIVVRQSALDKATGGGRGWLTNRFSVEPQTIWKLYYLYALERLMALSGLQEIAGHNWYDEGAAALVRTQSPEGYWTDNSGPVPATCFGVMFLVRATAKMLNHPQRNDPRFGGGLLVGGRGLPDNLQEVQMDKGAVKVRKLKGPVDELLSELENVRSQKVESAQAALVDTIATQDPEALIGQTARLLKLVNDRRPEVRRTVFWALGRTNDLRMAPVLIEGLRDPDLACMVEARNALRYISKRTKDTDLPDEPSEAQRAQAIAFWKKWYQNVRPYDERDDLSEVAKP